MASKNPNKAARSGKPGKPEQAAAKPILTKDSFADGQDGVAELEGDEIEDAEGIEDEPKTVEEANRQRRAGPAASKSGSKKADKAKEKAPKLTPEQRRAKREAEDKVVRDAGGVVKTASGKISARGLACLCGCGGATRTDEARFISGHDAQFRSRVIKGEQTIDSPESALIKPFYEAGETIAGFTFEGGELADVHAGSGSE
jgi:hypothetical protein